MKFNSQRTARRSSLQGLAQYEAAAARGMLRKVSVFSVASATCRPGVWEKLSLDSGFTWNETMSALRPELVAMRINTRELVIDELTRHSNTDQIFIPIASPFLAVVGASLPGDPDNPDPTSLELVPVSPGHAIAVKAGTWHTLPFAMVEPLICLSVMGREHLETYHDIRDLVEYGWVGIPSWNDPASIHGRA